MTRALSLVLCIAALAPGCTTLNALSDASRPLDIYEIRTPAVSQSLPRRRGISLIVEEPVTSGALATERILIRPTPLQAQYLPGVRWADTTPEMMRTVLVRALSDTGALASVSRRPIGTQADLAILSELTDFQADVTPDDTAIVRLRLVVRVIDERDERVIGSRTFVESETVAGTDPEDLIPAFDRVAAQAIGELVAWVIGQAAGVAG